MTNNEQEGDATEESRLEQAIDELEAVLLPVSRKMEVIRARHTTDMFRAGVGSGLPVSLQTRQMDAELVLLLDADADYQVLVVRKDDLSAQISKVQRDLHALTGSFYPSDDFGFEDNERED